MFEVKYSRLHQTALISFQGTLLPDDLTRVDQVAPIIIAAAGESHTIFDFSAVTSVDIPPAYLSARARQAQFCPGFQRVIVAPQPEIQAKSQLFATWQKAIGEAAPAIVASLDEAFGRLSCRGAEFKSLDTAWVQELTAEEIAQVTRVPAS